MSLTREILEGSDARAFGRHFFELVELTSGGEWVRYRDTFNRAVADLPDNEFVRWLDHHPRRRAKVRSVLERAAEAFPRIERRKDGEAQSAPVWFRTVGNSFDIITQAEVVADLFGRWRAALMKAGSQHSGRWETREGLFARTMPLAADGPLGERVALGVDPDGESWTVQINQPTAPKTHNVRSAVALSSSGRPGLVRQCGAACKIDPLSGVIGV